MSPIKLEKLGLKCNCKTVGLDRSEKYVDCVEGFTTAVYIPVELAKEMRLCSSVKREEREMRSREYKIRLKKRMIGLKPEKKKRWEK